eukprot:Gb_33533 [translate_table: standard]
MDMSHSWHGGSHAELHSLGPVPASYQFVSHDLLLCRLLLVLPFFGAVKWLDGEGAGQTGGGGKGTAEKGAGEDGRAKKGAGEDERERGGGGRGGRSGGTEREQGAGRWPVEIICHGHH